MSYFSLTEFISDDQLDHPQLAQRKILPKINTWINELDKVRSLVGFPIKITDSVRWGPVLVDPNNFLYLLLALYANPNINRICYYPPGELFAYGGFHIDKKFHGKHLFISNGDVVKWEIIDLHDLVKQFR
jgi:hypothetical protein